VEWSEVKRRWKDKQLLLLLTRFDHGWACELQREEGSMDQWMNAQMQRANAWMMTECIRKDSQQACCCADVDDAHTYSWKNGVPFRDLIVFKQERMRCINWLFASDRGFWKLMTCECERSGI